MLRRLIRWLAVPIVVGVIALAVVTVVSQRPSGERGFRHARRLPAPRNAILHAWVSDRDLIVFTARGRSWNAARVDAVTGAVTPLAQFNRAFARDLRRDRFLPDLSPDGRAFLWCRSRRQEREWVVGTLDGAARIVATEGGIPQRDDEYCRATWTRDGRRWIELADTDQNSPTLCVRGLGRGGARKRLTLPGYYITHLLGTTADSRDVVVTVERGPTSDIVALVPIDGGRPARFFPIRPPKGARVERMSLSPGGDRLAWVFRFRLTRNCVPGYVPYWVAQWFPSWGPPCGAAVMPPSRVSLFVSRLDGGGMRELDSVYSESGLPDLLAPTWTPDGKRLSFWHWDGLWIVPVDGS
jgi:hypothetical protein